MKEMKEMKTIKPAKKFVRELKKRPVFTHPKACTGSVHFASAQIFNLVQKNRKEHGPRICCKFSLLMEYD